jgi:DNA-binding response OmpR family regulator
MDIADPIASELGDLTMKPRILVVDDDEAITQQLYWTLADQYDVITANDMKTAIRRATFYKPDISILDLQMPPSDNTPLIGLQILEFIKGHLPNSRVLIMSSNDESEVQKACYDAGADEFFDKPFEVEDMLATNLSVIACS